VAQHKQQKRRPGAVVAASDTGRLAAATTFLAGRSRIIAVVLVAIASLRIAGTYPVFNQTFDEPLHIACGVEWLGSVVCADETPPLARVAAAAGPYLLGARSKGTPYRDMDSEYKEGAAILYRGHRYDLTLALARLGILPFFWIACLVVYQWGKRYGAGVAVVAVFLFSFLPPVLGHEGFLTQCVSNLLSNAIKFVAAGVVPRVRIWAEPRDTHVRINFQDNGVGVAPEDETRIFRMFERIHPAAEYEGTGIGLTIVRKAIERMGGRVNFESEPGQGTTFWLELPKSEA